MADTFRLIPALLSIFPTPAPDFSLDSQDVRDAIVSLGTGVGATQQATSRTLTLADAGTMIETTSASAITISVPTNAVAAFPINTIVMLFQYGAGLLSVAAVTPGTTTLRASPSLTGRGQYAEIRLRKRATDEWIVIS